MTTLAAHLAKVFDLDLESLEKVIKKWEAKHAPVAEKPVEKKSKVADVAAPKKVSEAASKKKAAVADDDSSASVVPAPKVKKTAGTKKATDPKSADGKKKTAPADDESSDAKPAAKKADTKKGDAKVADPKAKKAAKTAPVSSDSDDDSATPAPKTAQKGGSKVAAEKSSETKSSGKKKAAEVHECEYTINSKGAGGKVCGKPASNFDEDENMWYCGTAEAGHFHSVMSRKAPKKAAGKGKKEEEKPKKAAKPEAKSAKGKPSKVADDASQEGADSDADVKPAKKGLLQKIVQMDKIPLTKVGEYHIDLAGHRIAYSPETRGAMFSLGTDKKTKIPLTTEMIRHVEASGNIVDPSALIDKKAKAEMSAEKKTSKADASVSKKKVEPVKVEKGKAASSGKAAAKKGKKDDESNDDEESSSSAAGGDDDSDEAAGIAIGADDDEPNDDEDSSSDDSGSDLKEDDEGQAADDDDSSSNGDDDVSDGSE